MLAGAATRPDVDALELRLLEGCIKEMADGIALSAGAAAKCPPPLPLALPTANDRSSCSSDSNRAKRLMSRSLQDRRARRAALDARLATIDASIQGILQDLRALSSPRTRALAGEFGEFGGGGSPRAASSLLR